MSHIRVEDLKRAGMDDTKESIGVVYSCQFEEVRVFDMKKTQILN